MRHELFSHRRAQVPKEVFVLHIRLDGAVVELTQCTECQDQVNAANIARVMGDGVAVIQIIQDLFKVLALKHGAVEVEADKVAVDDVVDHLAVFGEPDIDGRGVGKGPVEGEGVGGRAGSVRVAANGDGYPVGCIARRSGLEDVAVAARAKATGADGEVLLVDGGRAKLEVVDDGGRDAEILCQGLE